ncbi:MAG: FAD-binding oxidoreductase [Chromatiales bacterium]|nr:FAD-binding oxidoreductase [Chromatiales bacterium]
MPAPMPKRWRATTAMTRPAARPDGIRALIGLDAYVGGDIDRGRGICILELAIGLARACAAAGVRLHEMSAVLSIEPGPWSLVRTAAGSVRAGHVLLAANGYLGDLVLEAAARVMPINNFIVMTEPLAPARQRSRPSR